METHHRSKETDQALPVIYRSPDFQVISNGSQETTLVGEIVQGMFRFFATNPNRPISVSQVTAWARSLGSTAKYPAQSGTDNLITALARIDRNDCLRKYYGTEFRFRARIEVDNTLTPNPSKYNPPRR